MNKLCFCEDCLFARKVATSFVISQEPHRLGAPRDSHSETVNCEDERRNNLSGATRIRCTHLFVISQEPHRLGAPRDSHSGTVNCEDERRNNLPGAWFKPCGPKGKLWRAKKD